MSTELAGKDVIIVLLILSACPGTSLCIFVHTEVSVKLPAVSHLVGQQSGARS